MRGNWQLCYQGGAQFRHQCQFLSSKTIAEISSQSISTALQRDVSRRLNEQQKSNRVDRADGKLLRDATAAAFREKRIYAPVCALTDSGKERTSSTEGF